MIRREHAGLLCEHGLLNHSVGVAYNALKIKDLMAPDITDESVIVAHDGVYPVHGGVVNLEYFNKECRLRMIVHFADKWTAAVEEEGRR
jgi:hypothetical protein